MPLDLFRRTRHWAATSETVRRWRRRRYELFMNLCDVEPFSDAEIHRERLVGLTKSLMAIRR